MGIPTIFQIPMAVPLHSPNGRQMPAMRVVQGAVKESKRIQWWTDMTAQFLHGIPCTVETPYNTAPYITGSNIARLVHGSQNSWSKLWIPIVKSAPVRVIFTWKSVPKKSIHGSSDIYLRTQIQWFQASSSTTPRGLTVQMSLSPSFVMAQ